MGFNRMKDNFWYYVGVLFLFLFPVAVVSLSYFNGLIIVISSFVGTYFYIMSGRGGMGINSGDKLFFSSVLFMVVVVFFVTLFFGFEDVGLKKLGKFLYLLMAIPVYFFFRRTGVSYAAFWYGLVGGTVISMIVSIRDVWPDLFTERTLERAGGISNPIIFGDLSIMLGVMSVAGMLWFQFRHRHMWLIPVIALCLGVGSSFFSQSRGGWLVIPVVAIVFIWYFSRYISKTKLASVSLLFIASLVLAYQSPQSVIKINISHAIKFTAEYYDSDITDGSRETSIGMRLEAWQAAWQIFLDNPVLGVGWGNYQKNAQFLVNSGLRNKTAARFSHPHNQYLSSMVSGGLVGLIATLSLFVVPIVIFIRVIKDPDIVDGRSSLALAGLILVISFAVCNLTESFLERSRPVAFFLFYLAVCMAGIHKKENILISDNEKII